MPNNHEPLGRKTLAMGRDTVVDSRKPLGPRGTQVLPSGQTELDAEPGPEGPSGQVVLVGSAKLPKSATNRKIDVSKADPRRMPTNVLAKRPSKFQAPDRGEPGEAAVAPAAGVQRWLFWLGVASLIALLFCALALGWFIHLRQQGRL